MSILVTGGAGYIGSHTVREILAQGLDAVVYDNLSSGYRESLTDVPFVKGDVNDIFLLEDTIRKYKVTSVIHFAGDIQVGESMSHPEKYYWNNVVSPLNLLKAMKNRGVKHIVFSSTAAVYGNPEETPITEESRKVQTSVYGRTKWMVEQILADYAAAYDMSYTCLRYFNACGAHKSALIGEAHKPETHLIPIIMQTLLGQREKVSIFGTDYPTPDGTCVRDYIHVTDLATAHILAVQALERGGKSAVYNLGNGNGFSVREIIKGVEKATGLEVPCTEEDRRPGDPAVLVASSEKAQKELGWKIKYTDIDEIIKTAWEWHKSRPEGYGE